MITQRIHDLRWVIVHGIPRPQGSKTPRRLANGRIILRESSKHLKAWRDHVTVEAAKNAPRQPLNEPVCVSLTFLMPRPNSHRRGGRADAPIKPGAPTHPTAKTGNAGGDIDKLTRAILDALVHARWITDDAIVTSLYATKRYADDRPGVVITMTNDHADQH